MNMKESWLHDSKTLFCCAHPSEARALPSGLSCLVTGVGKTASAVSLCEYVHAHPVERVFIFGVAGAFVSDPGSQRATLEVGELVWVQRDLLLDEGVQLEEGFLDLDALSLRGEQPQDYRACASWMQRLQQRLPGPALVGATVSTCSSTDALAKQRQGQAPVQVETMEGAALAHVCDRRSLPWVQLRAVSNRCGQRDQGGWDLPLALESLRQGLDKLLVRPVSAGKED